MESEPWEMSPEEIEEEKQRLEAQIAHPDLSIRAKALYEMTDLLQQFGPTDHLNTHLEVARDIFADLGDQEWLFKCESRLSYRAKVDGDTARAIEHALKAVEIHRENLLGSSLFPAFMHLAALYREQDSAIEAVYWATQARDLAYETGSNYQCANANELLSRSLELAGNYFDAAKVARQAYLCFKEEPNLMLKRIEALGSELWCKLNAFEGNKDLWSDFARMDALLEQMPESDTQQFVKLMRAWHTCQLGEATTSTLAELDALLVQARNNDPAAATLTNFIRAYCLHKLNRHVEALALLEQFLLADREFESRVDYRAALQLKIDCLLAVSNLDLAQEVAAELSIYVELVGPSFKESDLRSQLEHITQMEETMANQPQPAATMVETIIGDITRIQADAIVNAAKASLAGGGGVDGAIHRAAGVELAEACSPLAPCPPGEARVTPGFRLPAKYVVHTVGPVWHGGNSGEAELLASCYRNSLVAAANAGAKSIVFPGISTGIYGFPVEQATQIAVATIKAFVAQQPHAFERISLIWLTEPEANMARRLLN